MPSKRRVSQKKRGTKRREKKFSKKGGRRRRTRRLHKKGSGPGTQELMPIGQSIKLMYDTMYVNSHGSEDPYSNKKITPAGNYEDPEYIDGQIKEFDATIRQPLLNSKYGKMFLNGPTRIDRLFRGFEEDDNISKKLTELSSKVIISFKDLEDALKLAQSVYQDIIYKLETVKNSGRHEDVNTLLLTSSYPAKHAYNNYVTPAEGKRRPSVGSMSF
jgi:hypothetical protein